MPSGKLFKFKCKELFCGALVRSDKWIKHCKDKHIVKFNCGLPIKNVITEVREAEEKVWKKFTSQTETLRTDANGNQNHENCESKNVGIVNPNNSTQEDNEDITVRSEVAEALNSVDSNQDNLELDGICTIEIENSENCGSNNVGIVSLNNSVREDITIQSDVSNSADSDNLDGENGDETCIIENSMTKNDYDISDYSGKKLMSETINLLLQNKNSMNLGDKFMHAVWRQRSLPGGSKELRNWLTYSPKKDSIFCFTCVIFGSPGDLRTLNDKRFSLDGYGTSNDSSLKRNMCRDVENHENQSYHRNSETLFIKWMSPLNRYRLDTRLVELSNYWVKHHREVLSVVIDCCRYLSSEMMALRKSDWSKGKLVRLFTVFSKYNSDAKTYLEDINKNRNDPDKRRMRVNFLGYHSILKLVTIMKEMVLEIICERIKNAGKYAIISDSTQDISKKESVVLIARYIEEDEQNGITTIKPVERIIGAFTTGTTTGVELSKKCLAILEDCELDKKNVIGQSYDGASNMSGSLNGMKSLIEAECPAAVYIWCHAHRFALVVEKSLDNCIPLRNHFGILEQLYEFMNGHRRHSIFIECLDSKKKTV